jgi:quercetin dioxygenase-like cupin family protein
MYVTNNTLPLPTSMPGLDHVTLASSRDGLKKLSIWRQRIAPDGASPPHRHDCEEVVLVSAGSGELHVLGEVHAFVAGSTLILPANVPHQIINTGAEWIELTAVLSATPVRVEFPDGELIELPWVS